MVKRCQWLWAAWVVLAVAAAQAAPARQTQGDTGKVSPPPATVDLPATQQELASEFKDLQGILMKMRDQVRQTDPNRAALIEKALKESGERHVEADFQDIVDLLRRDKFGDAVRKQGKVNEDLDAILKLLLNEDRPQRIQSDKAFWRKILNDLNKIIIDQKDVHGRTISGDDLKSLSGEQGGLVQRTANLSKDIREREEQAGSNGKDGEKSDGKKDDKNGKEKDDKSPGKPADGKSKASDGKNKPSDGKSKSNDDGSAKSKGQGQGQSQEQEQGENQNDSPKQAQDSNNSPQEQNPVRKRLDAAKDHMEEAKKRLEKAKKNGALEEQKEALRELDTAKAELEEILRQLREEEMKQLLAMLEARFQRILQIQREIYSGTVRLDKIPMVERSHAYEIDTGRLSNREAEIVMEVEKALSLLRQEGSSVAMPEAVEQVHDDMQQLVHRLAEGKTEVLTQNIEMDVIKALEEIVDALKKAQKDPKKKPPGPSPNGQPQDPPLIEMLAELKMIRALQMRVNRRTERYSKLIDGEQANKDDVLDALRRLSEQEARVHKITRELELGRNE